MEGVSGEISFLSDILTTDEDTVRFPCYEPWWPTFEDMPDFYDPNCYKYWA
jgi:hypothetical protein